jgi:hypothetical protein
VKKNKIYFLFKKIIIFFFVRQDRHFAEDPPSLQLQVLQLALARGCGYPNPNGKKKSKKKNKKNNFFSQDTVMFGFSTGEYGTTDCER